MPIGMVERLRGTARDVIGRTRKTARPLAVALGRPLATRLAGKPPKMLSAMLRVRNEQEYLASAVHSIADLVDEIVIVDNLSDDATPQIIADLRATYGDKVRAFEYPHRIARYGAETVELASTGAGRRSPSFLPNYYNWCVAKCQFAYILKWDGDTVALPALAVALHEFRQSRSQALWYTGINLHESRRNLIKGRPYEGHEPRLFYRRFARYNHSPGMNVETLWSPYLMMFPEFSEYLAEPLYAHFKFCKKDRFTNISNDLQRSEAANNEKGDALSPLLQEHVATLGL